MHSGSITILSSTPDKAQVLAMAGRLGIDPDAVMGKLLRVWIWASENRGYDQPLGVPAAFLDRLAYQPGFAAAMEAAGWLQAGDQGLTFPHFDRHNGPIARERAATRDRVARHRAAAKENLGNAHTVSAETEPAYSPSGPPQTLNGKSNAGVTTTSLQSQKPETTTHKRSRKSQ